MKRRFWIAAFCIGTVLSGSAQITYTAPETVSDLLTGDTAIRVECPVKQFVALTQANSYTGGTELVSGGIIVSNVNALGTGPIRCHSGTSIRIMASYLDAGEDIKTRLFDKIEVLPLEDGSEPWVSILVEEEGLKNNIDFSGQPYLWLGTTVPEAWGSQGNVLQGEFIPYGNEYHFGHSGYRAPTNQGLWIRRLTDAPDGTPRKVVCRGYSLTTLITREGYEHTWSGGIVIEDQAYCSMNVSKDLGKIPEQPRRDFILLRGNGRIQMTQDSATLDPNIGITIDGSGQIHCAGNGNKSVFHKIRGPVSGHGKITLTDQGGIAFLNPDNTFDGEIEIENWHSTFFVDITLGDGKQCSWKGSSIRTILKNQRVIIDSDQDTVLATSLSGYGPIIKKGKGCLTLTGNVSRKAEPLIPIFEIYEGSVKLGSATSFPTEGAIYLDSETVLDLNRQPISSLPLPLGKGFITHSLPSVPLVLKGAATSSQPFWGMIEGDISVTSTSADRPWILHPDTFISGQVRFDSGSFVIPNGLRFEQPLITASNTVVRFEDSIPDEQGLTVKYWLDQNWVWQPMSNLLETVIHELSQTDPTLVTDTAAFGDYLKSGDAGNGTDGQPFAESLGGTKDDFGAEFSGYFLAEEEGDYVFQLPYEDDGAALFIGRPLRRILTTTDRDNTQKTLHLTKGRHPFVLYFLEKGGWEILHVKVKCPGDSQLGFLPMRLLWKTNGLETDLGQIRGNGILSLAEGARWPQSGALSQFTGTILANNATVSQELGALSLFDSRLLFTSPWHPLNGAWSFYGTAKLAVRDAENGVDLIESKSLSYGSINTRDRIPVQGAWELSFDFSIFEPSENPGDGFALVLHDSGASGHCDGFYNGASQWRLNDASAYGMQFYMMPWMSEFTWVKDCRVYQEVNAVVSNKVFTMNACLTSPMHVSFAYDGISTLRSTLTRGDKTWVSENPLAGQDLAKKFPNGAYLGIWGRCGGFYTGMHVQNLHLHQTSVNPEGETVLYASPLTLNDGTVLLEADGVELGELASPLSIEGDATLRTRTDAPIRCRTTDWTFGLANPKSRLTLADSDLSFGEQPITIHVTGDIPAKPRILADLTGVTGSTQPTFVLGADVPKGAKLTFTDGLLSIHRAVGTRILLQ